MTHPLPHMPREERRDAVADAESLFEVGRNCWRTPHADQLAVVIDAAHYFELVAKAIETAERSVFIIGWDLHSQVQLRPENGEPSRLAEVIEQAISRRPELKIRLLIWDFVVFYAAERELFTGLRQGWTTHPNISFHYASDHPIGGSHHQKVVVIDDALAFVGGIDLTVARWDRPEHEAQLGARRLPNGEAYKPFHDVQVAVSGDAAKCLGELARQRWKHATGEVVAAPEPAANAWPKGLEPDLESVEVAIARTAPAYRGRPAVREVQSLNLDLLRAARNEIYVENQYLTSAVIRDALAATLREPDGPEVVIVTPREQEGRLEQNTLGQLRKRFLHQLRQADRYQRLRVLYPLAAGDRDTAVNVHAKVLVIDDRALRIGSSNFTNRSMGLDTECDVAVEARGRPWVRQAIADIRDGLLAHHLGVTRGELREALAAGSFGEAIDELYARTGRMGIIDAEHEGVTEEALIADEVLDPHEPMDAALARSVLPSELHEEGKRRLPRTLLLIVALLALAAAWAWSPLREYVQPERLAELAEVFSHAFWGPFAFTFALALSTLLMVPVTALIVAGALLFGPWIGAVCGLLGSMISAALGYLLGRELLRDTVRRVGGKRVEQLSRALARRGILSILAVRVVPVAPYTVVNLVAGSSHVKFRDYMIGTFLGMAPGLLGLTVAADRVAAAVQSPDTTTVIVAAVVVAAVVAVLYVLRRWMQKTARTEL